MASSYLGVRMPAYNETDRSRATFTEDGVGLAESSMTETDRVHLQYLISTAAQRGTGVSTALSKTSLHIHTCTHIVSMQLIWCLVCMLTSLVSISFQFKDDPEAFT